MKITFDIDQLLSEGSISQDEYIRLKQFAAETTSSLALNIVVAFGIVAVAGGTIALLQSSEATAILGFILAVFGGYLCSAGVRWTLLGNVLLTLGALTGSGGIIASTGGGAGGFMLVAALLIAGALVARSGLLASLSVFALLAALGGSTGYQHAGYFLCIRQPLLTVSVFSILAALTYFLSRFAPPAYSSLATIFSRTAVIVVNFGFWIGSLWGDHGSEVFHSDVMFIFAWAIGIVAVGIWGARSNNRWLVNTAATFGAIHLYTQWFEHLGATPASVIVAGVALIAIAYALITYNRSRRVREAS